MEGKMKEVVVYIRKYFLFSLKFTCKFSCRHPFVASFAFFLFILYSCYPSLFAFLVSSSPVISCTALLLGILLSYGEPNIPEIEEDDKINREVSSLKEENSVDNPFVKKDENITLEDLVDSRVGSEERIFKDSASYGEKEREIDLLAIDLMKKQSESYMRMTEVADGVSEGIEGLMVKVKKPELDDWLDSSLGSPWQPVNMRDPSLDSESDRAESSSPDASITDILPMLDELSPLLDSETPHNASKSADNSDSELSPHHESDEDSVKEDEYKNEEKDESNKVVTWTADDHKNVMDLGSSDLERNRRLESLIARRRARKNQIIIYEKDLIDLHSNDMTMDDLFNFEPQIPPIFAPRRNPFDIPHELDESKGLPPIPGSAPSVVHRRQNPFDFQFDSEDGNKGHAEENLHQSEFRMPFQRGLSFRRHESFALHSAFPYNLSHKEHGSSGLNPYFVAERMDSGTNDYVDFHSQLSEKSKTKSSSAPIPETVSSAIDPDDQKVHIEQETQESIALSVPAHHTKPTEKCSHTYEDDLVHSQPEFGEDGHSVDPIASAVTEEAYQGIDASDIVKKNIEDIQFGENHEVLEGKHDDLTLFSSSESIEKSLDISLDEVLETHEQITRVSKASSESMQSSNASASHLIYETRRVDINQAAVPIYDSSPSGSGNFLANISVPDDNLLYSGREDIHSISTVESHVQEDAMESMTTEMIEFKVVQERKLQDSRSDTGETVTFSSYMNLLDENILASMGISETREQDFNENSSPRISEGFGDLATSLEIDHSSSLSSAEADYEPRLAFSAGFPLSEVMEKHQSMEKFEMQASFGTYLEQSLVSNLELGPILEENSEDFKVEEEHMSLVQTNTTSASTGLHILEGSDVTLSSVGQEVVSLCNQSKEEAQDEGNEVIPSKTSNLVSANEEMLNGLAIGELVDNMDSLNQSMIKSEPEFTSNDDISDSQDDVIDEFQINQDAILSNLNDFHSEHGEMDDDVREIQVIDEHLLSELDAVGDFHVEELKCQECLLIESQSDGQFICSEDDDSELRSAHVAERSLDKPISAHSIHPDEMDLVLNSEEPRDSGYFSLEMAPVEDLTVYNPKHRVLEASSVEELDSIFKQDRPRELVEPPLSESMVDKLVAEKPYIGSRSFDIVDQEIEAILQEAVLITLTGKNYEDINSVLLEDGREFDISASPHERQKYDHVESVIPSTSGLTSYASAIAEAEASSHELDISGRDFQIKETNSELLVLEAKSIEDIRSAFQNITEVVVNKSISPLIKPEPHPVDTVVEAMSHDVDKTSDLLVVQAKSAEDIISAMKKVTEEDFSDLEKTKNRLYYEVMEPSSPDTENSSDLFVLEARSAEDIRLAFKQTTAEVSAMPTPLIYSELSKTSQEHEVVEAMHLEAQYNIELPVPEEKPSEDIDSALDLDMPTSQVSPVSSANRNDGEIVDVKLLETQINRELLVLDAKYVEDIDSSFKPSSEAGLLRSTLLESDPDQDSQKDGSLKATINSELLVLEAESVEETSSTLMHATGRVFDKSSPLGYPEASGTSEVLNEISLGLENDSDIVSPETKSSLYLNSDCQQNIEANIVQPNLQEFENFQPDHEAIEERSLNAINGLELFNLESKSFEVTHSTFNEAAVDFAGQSTTALVDPGHTGQEVLDVKSPDSSNISDFPVLEEKYLEKLNLTFGQAMEGFLPKPASEVGAEHDSVGESCLAADEYSELVVLEEKSIENMQSPFSDANAGVHEGSSSLPVDPEPKETLPGREVEDNLCFEAENNAEMFIVEAKSIEDINSAFKQVTNVATSPLLVDSQSLGIGDPSSSLVLEAKSVELTDSSLKKAHQGDGNNSDFFTDPPPLQANTDKDSELLVLEEKSVEDIDSTLTQVTEGYLDSPVSLEDDSKQTETILEPKSATDSNVVAKQDSEVEYAKETIVASDEEVAGENSSSEDQINRRKDGEEAGSDNPSSISPHSMKIKKKKFEKSDSSSSSSSSSSD
ncbi:hypothetical protein KFK09_023811 [Dendrobium nobile]|uniref:Uncharacterized protein n=1 Tax=Dendrobium nobile TaxID=94219 RepID=A0A8T3AC44_DENNO|nr:hypothetical protein KFK09_023811 [Dendrobium nobile]